MSLHPNFAASANPNSVRSLMPHPPHSIGLATFSQATHGSTESSVEPAHKNLLQTLLIFSRNPFRTQISAAQ